MKNNLGKLIKETRIKKKTSKEELASKLNVKVVTINRWESNINKPSISYLILLSKELGLSFDELILGYEITKDNKKDSDKIVKDIVSSNIRYRNIFNVFTGIFVFSYIFLELFSNFFPFCKYLTLLLLLTTNLCRYLIGCFNSC